ncbi:hypothetical protein ABTZ99_43800 [Actinosynnema sp. NPDC002837]
MSHPETPVPQPSPPRPPATTDQSRPGHGLLATAILVAGIGGGLLAWHPWDKPVPEPAKDPGRITIQKVGEQREAGNSDQTRPVYCLTNETGGLYCVVMPNQYTGIQEER